MKKIFVDNYVEVIKIVCSILFITATLACTRDPLTIEGEVVDESGSGLNGVTVTACYSGWGWSSGQLVWDKDYCSEPVVTNPEGLYVINFEGPDFIRLKARKNGWIQTQDFNAENSRIILIEKKVFSERIEAEASLLEENFRQRLPDESDSEYYFRVVIARSRLITLNYQGETVSIVPTILMSNYRSDAVFAVRGTPLTVNSFANEAIFKINGQTVSADFSFNEGEIVSAAGMYFIRATIPGLNMQADARLEVLVPSVHAMLDMKIWIEPVKL